MNNISNDELLYKQKYLKYKSKYTELKQQGGLFGKETTLLFYNKNAYPSIKKAKETYIKAIQQNDIKRLLSEGQSNTKTKEPKYNEVTISNNDINGVPCMWKYTIGKGKLEPIFNIFMEFAGSSQKDKDTINKQKDYKTKLDNARKEYITVSTLDFQKDKVSGDISWDKFLSSVNCDNLKIKGTRLLNHINAQLCENSNLSDKRKEAYNKFIDLYQHALSTADENTDKTLRPVAITKQLGFVLENKNVKQWDIVDDFILVENLKQSGSGMLGLSSEQVLTFKINSINETIEPVNLEDKPPLDTRHNSVLPDTLTATPTSTN
jgi:hypothetical protein